MKFLHQVIYSKTKKKKNIKLKTKNYKYCSIFYFILTT